MVLSRTLMTALLALSCAKTTVGPNESALV
jgi:hypothetical protein